MIDKNSIWNNNSNAAALQKSKTKNKTEWIGFGINITNKEHVKRILKKTGKMGLKESNILAKSEWCDSNTWSSTPKADTLTRLCYIPSSMIETGLEPVTIRLWF